MYFTNDPDNFEFPLIPMQNESQLTTTLIERIDVLPRAKRSISKPPGRCHELKHMIGNTPLLAVRLRFQGRERVIYAKAEHINMTGSLRIGWRFIFSRGLTRKGAFNRAILSLKRRAATRESLSLRLDARLDIKSSSSCRIG